MNIDGGDVSVLLDSVPVLRESLDYVFSGR